MAATPWARCMMLLNLVTLVVMLRERRDPSYLADGLFKRFNSSFMRSFVLSPVEVHDFGLLLAHEIVLGIICSQLVLVVVTIIDPF